MDRLGVETAILSLTGSAGGDGVGATNRDVARLLNTTAHRAATDHPGRFGFFANLPIPSDTEAALAELRDVEQDPAATRRSRVRVLLANRNFQQTRTITHVLWTMLGCCPRAKSSSHIATSQWRSTSSSIASRGATRGHMLDTQAERQA